MENILPQEMKRRYELAKEVIENSQDIKIYSHTDCDGISSGAILSTILDRLNKPHEIEIVNLDVLEDLAIDHELTIFSDLGSGQNILKNAKEDSKIIVLDHHPPLRDIDYYKNLDFTYIEINPNHYGINGSSDICGGGLCYLLAKEFGFKDLSWIGILAAIGDMQNTKTGKLEGLNKYILEDAKEEGLIKSTQDLSLYGRKTRPLFVALSYFSDIKLPITNNKNETIAILEKLDIPRKIGDKTTTLSDLSQTQKGKLFSELIKMLSKEVPGKYVEHIPKLITADTYEFLKEEDHTFLRDASEFSTAMNACVRNNRPEVALEILKGDRLAYLDELEEISKDHRSYLAENIRAMENSNSIIQMKNIQYFDGTGIRSNVVGTIAGMILSYGDWRKPIIAFTEVSEENDDLKISLRCSRLLAYSGIHFGNIIREVAQSLGGNGGGHDVACGAYIPKDKKDEFLNLMNEKLEGQLEV
ncbi:MAG: single-stranded-DNA-specific exonuclease RecJ [Methanobacteriaceae archaeon]|nr:single-stranded-DNA-specific exonuclease RecJ [Methanobacteriaceae archaeon]